MPKPIPPTSTWRLVWPLAAHAQQAAMPVIGFLGSGSADIYRPFVAGFRQGLTETGYIEGQNVTIEFRWPEGDYTRLPAPAADLVDRRVSVIVAGGPPAARAANAATSTIPIVFTSGDDPVQIGLVPSLNSPGGNITGVYLLFSELSAKKLGLLHDLLPQVNFIAALLNPTTPSAERQAKDLQLAARTRGFQIQIVNAASAQEIDAAFGVFAQRKVGAVIVGSDPAYSTRREQIIALTTRYAIPAIYELRHFVDAGGLMSYGTNIQDGYRLAGAYVGRILKGEKPANLPVIQETKFELVINIKTAKSLGINISDNLLSLADEVIE
ncbi:MAG TPA: ABC transporter substrate-binding protein [Pseudolabrys sp.]|nr:ABC transporter substrate-binding protein [Pseudolabrys sp.]